MQGGVSDLWPDDDLRPEPTAVERAGREFDVGAVPVAAIVSGDAVVSAWGDGRLRIFRAGDEPEVVVVHNGPILSMALARDGAILTGGDDGLVARTTGDGTEELARHPRKWVDHVAAGSNGATAYSVGRTAHVSDPDGMTRSLDHPSTVGGMAFDRKGARLAVAHYGGITVWTREKRRWKPSSLKWAGSHTAVTWSPDDRFVMSAMQENALHGWRLRDKADLRMSGYPAKVKSWAWAGETPWLATSGAQEAILWRFDGRDGPMGKAPLQLCGGEQAQVTAVFALPGLDAVLAGFADGRILFSDLEESSEPRLVKRMPGAAITALAVTPRDGWLFAAHADGNVLWAPLGKR